MAELIDKGALIRELESVSFTEDAKKMKVDSDAEMDGFFKGYVEGMLYFIPTTTEAEIRTKAYDEFAEKLKEELCERAGEIRAEGIRHMAILTLDNAIDIIQEIAEQLKGE